MSKRRLIFVVDDDPSTLRGLKRLLGKHGYDSVLFQSAEDFERHGDFEGAVCVVLDIQLNGLSGIELKYRLASAGVLLPVIYITANDNESTRLAATQSGCAAYLTKPFSAKALLEPIERLAARLA